MSKKNNNPFGNLPVCAAEFIKPVVKKMRYRKKVRADVQAELIAHFEDGLKECKTDKEKEKTAQKLIEDFGDVKLLAVLLRRAKKRCRPLWRTIVARTFQTAGVLIICFILYCVYISFGSPTISTNYVKEATNLVRPVVDESQNAAVLYQKAIDSYKEAPLIEKEPLLQMIKDKQWISELSEQELSLLRQWLLDNGKAIEYYKQGSQRPYCWWDRSTKIENDFIHNAMMSELGHLRNITKLTVWQTKLDAHDGKVDKAFDGLLACYRVGMHFKGPRTLIEQLVGMAIQAIAVNNILIIIENQSLSNQTLRSLHSQFEKLVNQDTFAVNYKVESFLAFDFIQRCYTDDGRGSGHMIPRKVAKFIQACGGHIYQGKEPGVKLADYAQHLAMAAGGASRHQMKQAFDDMYNIAQKSADKIPWQLKEQNINLEQDFENWSFVKKVRYWPVTFLTPALTKISELSFRAKIGSQSVITILAVLRYKKDKDDFPENLDKLIDTGYLKQLPIGPYSNKTLIYKKTDDNFILYSIGADFDDDGGVHSRWGQDEEGGDYVFWPIKK